MESCYEIINADCRVALPNIEPNSLDAVITDPPYAEIDRNYGRLTEPEWHDLMDDVISQVRRILKPHGSAVFILQPNSKHVGQMRPWLWEFIARYANEWNLVQDFYWWNPSAPPNVHCQARHGLLRPSVKYCVWFGEPDSYRDQAQILWTPSQSMKMTTKTDDWELRVGPSGYSTRNGRIVQTVQERGGVTPFNLLPLSNSEKNSAGSWGHGAGTPYDLCDFWTRYIVPRDGVVLDPFAGLATTGLAAKRQGKSWIGIEAMPEYAELARERLETDNQPPLSKSRPAEQSIYHTIFDAA